MRQDNLIRPARADEAFCIGESLLGLPFGLCNVSTGPSNLGTYRKIAKCRYSLFSTHPVRGQQLQMSRVSAELGPKSRSTIHRAQTLSPPIQTSTWVWEFEALHTRVMGQTVSEWYIISRAGDRPCGSVNRSGWCHF